MKSDVVFFKNRESLKEQCKRNTPFYLIYRIGSIYDKHLKSIANECIHNRSCLGIAFSIDKENHFFNDLFFLKYLVEKLLRENKSVGIWGVPQCVSRRLLDGYLYMRMLYFLIPETIKPGNNDDKIFFKEKCRHCIDKSTCQGLGRKNFHEYKPRIKRSNFSLKHEGSKIKFDSGNKLLNERHEAFLQHCQSIESPATYRTVYYVANIDFHSLHSYRNRFIYGCDYLSPDEYPFEFGFLNKHVINRSYAELIETISNIDKTSQIAYSLAEKNGNFRESFYMFVTKNYGTDLLDDFGIRYDIPRTKDMQFIGAGFDVLNSKAEYFKLYFQSPKGFIVNYFKACGIDLSTLSCNSHYVVLRLDKFQNLLSYKIEVAITYNDLPIFKELLPGYDYYEKNLVRSGNYNLAVEFEHDSISKINIYHRERFA